MYRSAKKPYKIFRLCSLMFFSVLFISGCVSLRAPSQQANFQPMSKSVRQAQLTGLRQWQIAGALSIQQKDRANLANYSWQQSGQRNYQIRLSSSLNLYNLTIIGQPGRVVLVRSGEQPTTAASPEQLLRSQLGWSLPVSNMYYWVRGLSAPGAHRAQYDQYGHLINLAQQGWYITYQSYSTVRGIDLPRVMYLSRPSLNIKIVIRSWNF